MTKILTSIFFALVMCTATISKAAELPIASTVNSIGYDTEQLAAEAGLATAVEQSQVLEQAGGIAFFDGKYFPTNAVSNNDPEHFAIRIQFKGKLTGIFHTHPNGTSSDSFSKDDKNVAEKMKVHSYIKSVPTNGVYMLADGHVTQIGEHSLCHGMECKEYYAMARHQVLVLYGMVRK